MKNTKIEWCDHTVNLWWGCSEVSEACKNCYARGIAKRFGKDCWGRNKRLFRLEKASQEIAKLNDLAKRRGVVETVFINSMSDFFDERVIVEIRLWVWEEMRAAKNLQFLILTKRANVMANHLALYSELIPCNVHLGITAENQARLDERMSALSDFKGKLFLSCEPLLDKIDITPYADRIDWIICGGETGANARHFSAENCAALYAQTRDVKNAYHIGIPWFFKKRGNNPERFEDWEMQMEAVREYPAWHSKGVVR